MTNKRFQGLCSFVFLLACFLLTLFFNSYRRLAALFSFVPFSSPFFFFGDLDFSAPSGPFPFYPLVLHPFLLFKEDGQLARRGRKKTHQGWRKGEGRGLVRGHDKGVEGGKTILFLLPCFLYFHFLLLRRQ